MVYCILFFIIFATLILLTIIDMKRLLIYTSLFFVSITCLFSCGNPNAAIESTSIEEDFIEREQFIQDSIAHEQFIQDSVEQATVAAETIARLKSKFTEKKDEFNDVVWIKPNNAPRYTDRNGVYCYFAIKNGIAYNFRFRYQYYIIPKTNCASFSKQNVTQSHQTVIFNEFK